VSGELDGLPRAWRPHADQDWHPAGDDAHHPFGEALPLFGGEVRELAGASQWRDPAYPRLYKPFHHRLGGLKVDLSPFVEGRNHRGHQS